MQPKQEQDLTHSEQNVGSEIKSMGGLPSRALLPEFSMQVHSLGAEGLRSHGHHSATSSENQEQAVNVL